MKWLREAAAEGNASAMDALGQICYSGTCGLAVDEAGGMEWFKKAAELGKSTSQWRLGRIYAEGKLVPRDDELALDYLGKAAAGGEPGAYLGMAAIYKQKKDEASFVAALRYAVATGDADAELEMATLYSDGSYGFMKDEKEYARLLTLSAEHGNALAQYYLGSHYLHGVAVEKDMVKSMFWLRKAAEQGHPDSQGSIGFGCFSGDVGYQDLVEAYMWTKLSLAQEMEQQNMDRIKINLINIMRRMTPEQVAEGDALVAKWQPK